ncbi:unnamed protein product, partial [marine sediment metagenome]
LFQDTVATWLQSMTTLPKETQSGWEEYMGS